MCVKVIAINGEITENTLSSQCSYTLAWFHSDVTLSLNKTKNIITEDKYPVTNSSITIFNHSILLPNHFSGNTAYYHTLCKYVQDFSIGN